MSVPRDQVGLMDLLLIADTHVPKRARDLPAEVWDQVVGHSHIPWDSTGATGLRLLNPGSPTDRRRQPHCTYMTATVTVGVVDAVTLHRIPTAG